MSNELQSELDEVSRLLGQIPAELDSPLQELVSTQLESLKPHLRALFVLAAGTHEQEPQDTGPKRVYLATALETLYLALNIHKYLLDGDSTENGHYENKSYAGSMILAGDYCFSRSAEFAARTDSPTVVSIFSEALGTVSEGHLRHLHENTRIQQNKRASIDSGPINASQVIKPYNESFDLLEAGTAAALELCQMPPDNSDVVVRFSKMVAALCLENGDYREDDYLTSGGSHDKIETPLLTEEQSDVDRTSTDLQQTLTTLPPRQQPRWKTLVALATSRN